MPLLVRLCLKRIRGSQLIGNIRPSHMNVYSRYIEVERMNSQTALLLRSTTVLGTFGGSTGIA